MKYQYDYAVIGGDSRQIYLAKLLAQKKQKVCCYNLCTLELLEDGPISLYNAASMEEAITGAAHIIGPTPFCKTGTIFHQNKAYKERSIDDLFPLFSPGQILFGGSIPHVFQQCLQACGVDVFDFTCDNALYHFNTIATAEGAICEAISTSPVNLHKSSCAVLGYGKCGATLCQYLKGMFCHLFVAENLESERSKASLLADDSGTLDDFYAHLEKFDFIFNTIPLTVLTTEYFKKMKPTVTIIDIASAPGGLDHSIANKMGLCTKHCSGLPGIYAPLSSAKAMLQTIEKRSKENATCL